MPPSPEVPDSDGKIWRIKVFHQLKSHDFCRPDGDHGITAKITVDLNRESHRRQRDLSSPVHAEIVKYRIHRNRDPVCNDHLHEESPDHENPTGCHSFRIPHLNLIDGSHLIQ